MNKIFKIFAVVAVVASVFIGTADKALAAGQLEAYRQTAINNEDSFTKAQEIFGDCYDIEQSGSGLVFYYETTDTDDDVRAILDAGGEELAEFEHLMIESCKEAQKISKVVGCQIEFIGYNGTKNHWVYEFRTDAYKVHAINIFQFFVI